MKEQLLSRLKLHFVALWDVALLAAVTLGDVDSLTRVVAGIVGIIVGIVTVIRLWSKYRNDRTDQKIKNIDLEIKEEQRRRFFQEKYSNENHNSDT